MPTLDVTAEELKALGLVQGADGTWRAKLWLLWKWRWGNNPKQHAAEKIAASVHEHGFNDDIGIDPWLELVLEGHGRLEFLMAEYETNPANTPKRVQIADDNDWLVPVNPLKFDSRYAALRYALAHNTAGTNRTQRIDYSTAKLKAASEEQIGLFDGLVDFNFEEEDAKNAEAAKAKLPEPQPQEAPLEIFDPGDLPDKPEATGVKSKMLWMSFQTSEELNLALRLLSFGERRQGIGEEAFYASFPGKKYLERWKKVLGPFAGESTPAAEEALEDKQILQSGQEWDAEGKCVECKGTGSMGHSTGIGGTHTPIYCSACGGWGNREAFEQHRKVTAELQSLGMNEVQEAFDNEEVTGVEEA